MLKSCEWMDVLDEYGCGNLYIHVSTWQGAFKKADRRAKADKILNGSSYRGIDSSSST